MLFLLATMAATSASLPAKMRPDREIGQTLYRELCWQCHGAQGLGDGPVAESLDTESPALAGRYPQPTWSDSIDVILSGSGDMPGFSTMLGRPDSRRIMLWLLSLDENGVPKSEAAKAGSDEPSPDDDAQEGEGEGAR